MWLRGSLGAARGSVAKALGQLLEAGRDNLLAGAPHLAVWGNVVPHHLPLLIPAMMAAMSAHTTFLFE
jgi:hypothetical protein